MFRLLVITDTQFMETFPVSVLAEPPEDFLNMGYVSMDKNLMIGCICPFVFALLLNCLLSNLYYLLLYVS